MLYPKMSEHRTVISLDGIWNFRLLSAGEHYNPAEALTDGIPMPVPSSYNDIYEGRDFKNHVGNMVYERFIGISGLLLAERLVLRFGSVTHQAKVYLNGTLIKEHKGGFLPFEVEIGASCMLGENRITVIVNNIVDHTTLPCGRLVKQKFPGLPEKTVNLPNFDFFNYSGIMRPVVLYTTSKSYISDIRVNGKADGSFLYKVESHIEESVQDGAGEMPQIQVYLKDAVNGEVLWHGNGSEGGNKIENVCLWSTKKPYLYHLCVQLTKENGTVLDEYTELFGFREFAVKDGALWLNGEKIYLKGFGKHEDSAVLGRGYSAAYNVKDIALMKWMGANSFRTSHYPYSEEMMQLCDREGILVIDEIPAVGLHTGFTATGLLGGTPQGTWKTLKTAEHHREVIEELIARDKNHPCVIAFSIANEPASEEEGAAEYFQPLFSLAKELDFAKRPVTVVTYGGATPETCKVAELCDFLMVNRYNGWYDTEGDLKGAAAILSDELERFHKKYLQKPIVFGEFGADAIAGMHDVTGDLFSEEYQEQFLKTYCELFDTKEYVCGEHVWNFADFATAENIKRVQGNKKGLFTRERKPKKAVWYMRERWTKNTENR